MSNVGLFGGSFNPPHLGHLICAQEAAEQLELDRVVLIPLHTPTHRALPADPGPQARLALCQAAVDGSHRLTVSATEVERGGTSYSIDTLRSWRGANPDDELTLIVGNDVAAEFPSWREPAEVLASARLAVVSREGESELLLAEELSAGFPGSKVVSVTMTRVDISSSLVRERVGAGRSIEYLVPAPVDQMIGAEGWYR
ncbi:MAG: nicotinate-nucleotide adenylyltransferase [Solirubrobacteraceae bacterium]|jgi:nicotinate-nucleotide adenylyltransferase|nr:nicotinate-nucleotide adenylyltransferase [Solirubrobacteraceae bacterium]MDP4672742.1 nicotinate-nucleotide adenylyltransferase [Solirubrobacteraceae bacterium]MDP4920596.1 nicotinate-nucleotide adenylyltransferase [Solirubrobacteraceae bacterium]